LAFFQLFVSGNEAVNEMIIGESRYYFHREMTQSLAKLKTGAVDLFHNKRSLPCEVVWDAQKLSAVKASRKTVYLACLLLFPCIMFNPKSLSSAGNFFDHK
jgi:hypothetical protein